LAAIAGKIDEVVGGAGLSCSEDAGTVTCTPATNVSAYHTRTWGTGSSETIWTWDTTGTDPTIRFASDEIGLRAASIRIGRDASVAGTLEFLEVGDDCIVFWLDGVINFGTNCNGLQLGGV